MTPQRTQQWGTFQRNLNTTLLSIILAISGWVLITVIDLKVKMGETMGTVRVNSASISDINKVNSSQSGAIMDLGIRLTKLETIQIDQSNKK